MIRLCEFKKILPVTHKQERRIDVDNNFLHGPLKSTRKITQLI